MNDLKQEINNLWIRIFVAYLVIFIIVLTGLFSVTFLHKQRLADSFALAARNCLVIHDLRQAVMTLSPAIGSNFDVVSFRSSEGQIIFRLPSQIDGLESGWFNLHFETPLYQDQSKKNAIIGYLDFYYRFTEIFLWAIGLWVVSLGFAIPIFRRMKSIIVARHGEIVAQEQARALSDLARQTAHDIRSPISALNMAIARLRDVPDANRTLIGKSIERINEIADSLLRRGVHNIRYDINSESNHDLTHISLSLTEVVAEKQFEFIDRNEVNISLKSDEDVYSAFTKMRAGLLKRIVSNLVNNAVEAIPERGAVRVELSRSGQNVTIRVNDTGIGIPNQVIGELGRPGASFGKKLGRSGSGLGLYHAKQSVEAVGGRLEITSQINVGTGVSLILPLEMPPKWFLSSIDVVAGSIVLTVDDDPLVHKTWAERFKGSLGSEHLSFERPADFVRWFKESGVERSEYLLLIDQNFPEPGMKGIGIVKSLGLEGAGNVVLVTDDYGSESLMKEVSQFNIKLLPKCLLQRVPIREADKSETDRFHRDEK